MLKWKRVRLPLRWDTDILIDSYDNEVCIDPIWSDVHWVRIIGTKKWGKYCSVLQDHKQNLWKNNFQTIICPNGSMCGRHHKWVLYAFRDGKAHGRKSSQKIGKI